METPKDTVTNLIAKVAEELQYVDYDADINEISSDGASLTSVLFMAKLRAKDKEELNLFAKVADMGIGVRENSPIACPFTTEIYFYSKVLKRFELLQEKHSIPEEHRLFFPKVYGINDQYLTETILLENLEANGFTTHGRQETIDLEYGSAAITLMAKFHALSLVCYKEDPDSFEEVLKKLNFDTWSDWPTMESIVGIMRPKMTSTAMAALSDENRKKLEKFLNGEDGKDRFLQYLSFYHGTETRLLGHGDFKPSNLMHRRRDGKLQIVPVDFQMVHTSSPVADLMYFFFTGADEEFRRQHYHELLDLYYEQLKLALGRFHVDSEEVYPEKQYRKELEEAKMSGLMIGIIRLPMVTVAEENLPTFDDSADLTDFMVPGSELYKERFNGVLNNYRGWGLL